MKILVSGATGFVGGTITRHLLEAGHEVRAMSRSTGKALTVYAGHETGRRALADGRLTFAQADVTRQATLLDAVRDVDVVVQAAQFTGAPVEDPAKGLTYDMVDRRGTVNLLAAICDAYGRPTAGQDMRRFPTGTPRFIYMSGVSVSPDSPYSWDQAKWQAEEAIRGSGLEWTIVRSSWAYGRDDAALNRILHYSDHLPFVPIFGDGREPLTPTYVEDIGRFFTLLVAHPDESRDTLFALGSPDMVTLNQFLHLALRAMGRIRPILHIPKPLGRLQGAVMYNFPGRPLSPAAVDFVAQAGAVTGKDRELLAERFPQFRATPVREGLASYLGG